MIALAKAVARALLDDLDAMRIRTVLRARYPGAAISHRATVVGDPARIQLGERVSIGGPSSIVVVNGGGLTDAALVVGNDTYIGEFANIRSSGTSIVIGSQCLLAQNVTIVGSNHGTSSGRPIFEQEWSGTGVEIGDDVWIGASCVVIPGARIGSGAVIAANSVVRGVVPPNAIMAGSPARQVGERRP